jgi:hypothetical protein
MNDESPTLPENYDTHERTLTPVTSKGEIKGAVLEMILSMPNDLNTHKFMLYILRVLDQPDIILSDISYLDNRESIKKRIREMKERSKTRFYTAVSLVVGISSTAILSLVMQLVG